MIEMLTASAIVSLFAGFVGWFVKVREKRRDRRNWFLRRQYEKARADRVRWLEDHSYIRNPFDHDFYHVLWERELGAQALWCIHDIHAPDTSYYQYNRDVARQDSKPW